MRRLGPVAGLVAALSGFGLVTWLALESQEVAVLHTRSADGQPRSTRVWLAREGGDLWLEAATAERGWYGDLLADADVELEVAGARQLLRAHAVPGREAHLEIRRRLREKYGWADAWVGLVQDTSQSVAVRLESRTIGESP
jgi:hypothetical protein